MNNIRVAVNNMACCFLFCMLMGCSKKVFNADDYVKYMETKASGMRKEKNIGTINIAVQYKTPQYIAIKERRMTDADSINNITAKLEGMQYYTIRYNLEGMQGDIMKYDLHSEQEYFERLNYMSYGLQNDIKVVEGKDTLSCVLFNHARNYGISPVTEIVAGFEENKKVGISKEFIIDEHAFGLGTLKFTFDKSDLADLPELKTE